MRPSETLPNWRKQPPVLLNSSQTCRKPRATHPLKTHAHTLCKIIYQLVGYKLVVRMTQQCFLQFRDRNWSDQCSMISSFLPWRVWSNILKVAPPARVSVVLGRPLHLLHTWRYCQNCWEQCLCRLCSLQ